MQGAGLGERWDGAGLDSGKAGPGWVVWAQGSGVLDSGGAGPGGGSGPRCGRG